MGETLLYDIPYGGVTDSRSNPGRECNTNMSEEATDRLECLRLNSNSTCQEASNKKQGGAIEKSTLESFLEKD